MRLNVQTFEMYLKKIKKMAAAIHHNHAVVVVSTTYVHVS